MAKKTLIRINFVENFHIDFSRLHRLFIFKVFFQKKVLLSILSLSFTEEFCINVKSLNLFLLRLKVSPKEKLCCPPLI